jgi:hypothetical protein
MEVPSIFPWAARPAMTGRAVFIGDPGSRDPSTSAGGEGVIGAGFAGVAATGALGTLSLCAGTSRFGGLRRVSLHLT